MLIFYAWQVFTGEHNVSILDVVIDLACVFPALLMAWLAFFAQFVLPVRTREDRKKIFDRLLTDLFGGHGPAMFIRNGELIKREGEERKKGPGVLWLDSASAAVTRTAVKIKQTLGPGVHFIDSGEYIAGIVDLHIQSQTIGLRESDDPFAELGEDIDEEEYDEVQDRRRTVSALTRDGIEVIPTISIAFRVDTGFPEKGEPGSRFGFRTGITKKTREQEAQDKEAIRKAILGEGVNPNIISDATRRRVAWNELPASIAVDVWREYASKFTLDELFKPDQLVPPPPPEQPQPTSEEVDPLTQPILLNANHSTLEDKFAVVLRSVNLFLARMIRRLEGKPKDRKPVPPPINTTPPEPAKREPTKKTGLQVINELVNARLKKAEVPILDDHGARGEGAIQSQEYQLLKSRGISVLSVGISNLRLNPEIEAIIMSRWSASWYNNAMTEKKQIKRKQELVKSTGQDTAIRQHANLLSKELINKKPSGIKDTLKTLLLKTRTIIIKDDQLRGEMKLEKQALEEILQWIEADE